MDRDKILAMLAAVISLALLALPRIMPICTGLDAGGNPMRCHYAYQAEFLVTLPAVVLAGGLFVVRSAEARSLAGFMLSLLGLVIIVLPQPWAVGICFRGMACEKTALFTVLGGGLLALTGAIVAWRNHAKKTPGQSEQ